VIRQKAISIVVTTSLSLVAVGCKREQRILRTPPPATSVFNSIQVSGIVPGAHATTPPMPPNIYEESAYAVAEGQKLYEQFNCSGCHFHGGGGIGPPLMDNKWIYGSEPQNIFATIMEGRPNGMPSFRNRIPEVQAWEIVGYVRSLSGLLPKDVSPARSYEMNSGPAPESTPRQQPQGITGNPEQAQR